MSQYVTIMEQELLDSKHKVGEIIELNRMVLEVLVDSTLFPMDCTISWDEESFEADVKWLQENAVRGYITVDLEGGEFVRYKLTDDGVEKAAGRVFFSGDPEVVHGPLMVTNEDIESLANSMPLSEREQNYLREQEEELTGYVGNRIMEEYYMNVLQEEAEDMLANMEYKS